LSGLSSFDSSAVSAVLAWRRDADRRGMLLQVQGVPAGLDSLAGLYGVEHLLTGR
jgi:phospholipid transport system transporter-binding protein